MRHRRQPKASGATCPSTIWACRTRPELTFKLTAAAAQRLIRTLTVTNLVGRTQPLAREGEESRASPIGPVATRSHVHLRTTAFGTDSARSKTVRRRDRGQRLGPCAPSVIKAGASREALTNFAGPRLPRIAWYRLSPSTTIRPWSANNPCRHGSTNRSVDASNSPTKVPCDCS